MEVYFIVFIIAMLVIVATSCAKVANGCVFIFSAMVLACMLSFTLGSKEAHEAIEQSTLSTPKGD